MKPLTAEEIAELRMTLVEPSRRWNAARYARVITFTRDALPRLLDEVERARALLKRIEWKGDCEHAFGGMCPDCGGTDKHEPGCELAALIAGCETAPTWTPSLPFKPGEVITVTTFERDGTRRSETRILDADGVTFRPLRPGER